jgi:arylsulfatase A-like enzyme
MAESRTDLIRARTILAMAATLALITGLAEVLTLGIRWLWLRQFVWAEPRVAWLAPLGYLILFGLPALVPALATRLQPARAALALAFTIGGPVFLGIMALLRVATQQRLYVAASAVLAAGLAYQAGRWGFRHPDRAVGLSRRWLPRLAVIVLLLAGVTEGRRIWDARKNDPGGSSVTGRPPNVLLLVLDTVGADELSLYGYSRPTSPVLERWGRRAVVFDHAFATASWTLPSHASMFTGRWPHELAADWLTRLPEQNLTLAEVLRSRGYVTGGFVANLYYTTRETGLSQGFRTYEDYPISLRQILLSTESGQLLNAVRIHNTQRARVILRAAPRKAAEEVNQEFLGWESRMHGRPFFAFLNYFDAHMPYTAPDSLRRRFRTGASDRDEHDAAIAHLDRELGLLLDELARRGVLERTLVIITGDHGEQFGAHGLLDHGNSLYARLLRVPLLILLPGGERAGLRISAPVTLRNLSATVLDVIDVEKPYPLPGTGLARFWQAADPGAEPEDSLILSELTRSPRAPARHRNSKGELRSLVSGPWHYILNRDGSAELYDYRTDPEELRNLAETPIMQSAAVREMAERLRLIDSLYPRDSKRR